MDGCKLNEPSMITFRSVTFAAVLGLFVALGAASAENPKPWMNKQLSFDQRADLVLKEMTLDEKIQLLHG